MQMRERSNAFDESSTTRRDVEWIASEGADAVRALAVFRNGVMEIELPNGWQVTTLNVDTIEREYLVHVHNTHLNVRQCLKSRLARDDDRCVWQVGHHQLRWIGGCATPRKRKLDS
jgi:hypothetical protein